MNQYSNIARYDTAAGLVPCKIIDLAYDGNYNHCKICITRSKGSYKAGEVIETIQSMVIPVQALCKRQYRIKVKGYIWYIGENGINAVIQPFTYS